jgi:ABC-type spermidine/putrescine transport system permease subunit II
MQEFPITLLISGLNYTTLPLALYDTLQRGSIEPASASAVILLIPSVIYLLVAVKYLRLTDISAGLGRA